MNMINRLLKTVITGRLFHGKAIVIIGPRQVGKTTLVKEILRGSEYLILNGDDLNIMNLLNEHSEVNLKRIIGRSKIVFIDEAQKITNIGITSKIIIDQFKDVQLILSGSSALEINNKTQEPLTGRKWEYQLFPISWEEYEAHTGFLNADMQLNNRLIFGMYPDVINNEGDEKELLKELSGSYLYKDILSLQLIRKPDVIVKLLTALALQLGSEVSYNELANLLGIDKMTVMNYIDVLEKLFIVFTLNSFSRNQRNEIKNNKKIYFYDNGIRNSVINNFNSLELRNDKGALWENFIISERMKMQKYRQIYCNRYFWRTQQKQEIDLVEEANGLINAFEIKWKSSGKIKSNKAFMETYQSTVNIIDRENFREFIMQQ